MITASASPSECSLCHRSRAEWPSTLRKACTASWSQFEAGNWRTAKFMVSYNTCVFGAGIKLSPASFNFKPVIFNDRVAQDTVASVVDLAAGDLAVRAVQFDFEILADVHRADAVIAHLGERV